MTPLLAIAILPTTWTPVTISWYSMGKITSDGTKMALDGRWVATRRLKLGTVVEVRVGKVVQRLTVRDRTAKRFGQRFDIPRDTWKSFGAPLSRGLLKGEFRVIRK